MRPKVGPTPDKNKTAQKGFAHLGLILFLVVIVAAIVAGGFFVLGKQKGSGFAAWLKGCSGNNKVTMTHSPIDIDDVALIAPLGLTAGAHVTPIDHLYFYPKAGPRDKYPVYAMADGAIIEIQPRNVSIDSGQKKPPEYRIVMQHSCQTISYFDLVTKLDPSVLSHAKNVDTKDFNGRIPVKAGQEIGRIGAQTLDTAIYDANLTLPGFIHPSMYTAEPWKVHTADFFGYFSEPLLGQMLAKDVRKSQPYSGKIDYDQAGKLIGNWFKEGTNGYAGPKGGTGVGDNGRGYWNGHLAIFYDAIDPTKIVVSIGDFKDGQPNAYNVSGNTPDPATVDSNSGVVKYELYESTPPFDPDGNLRQQPANHIIAGTILLQVMSGEKLKVETFPGKSASEVSGFNSPTIYER